MECFFVPTGKGKMKDDIQGLPKGEKIGGIYSCIWTAVKQYLEEKRQRNKVASSACNFCIVVD